MDSEAWRCWDFYGGIISLKEEGTSIMYLCLVVVVVGAVVGFGVCIPCA